jgi:hypothetical protein
MLVRRAAPLVFAAALGGVLACASSAPSPRLPAVAGSLRYGSEWVHARGRAATEEWVVYSFEARAGDKVEAYVQSSAKAPVARFVDDAEHVLAESAVAHPDGDTMAVVTSAAPRTGTYYLFLRDASDSHAKLSVQLAARFACRSDAECERAGQATGPSPLSEVPFCLFAAGDAQGECKSMTRESVEKLTPCGKAGDQPCPTGWTCSGSPARCAQPL